MTTQCSSTANAITEVLLVGDAVLNLTQQPLNAVRGTQFVSATGDSLSCGKTPMSVVWKPSLAFSLTKLVVGDVTRLVIVSEEHCSDAEIVVRELSAHQIPHLHCTLMNACDVDAFMDEADIEAVTERLRQLG